MTSHHPQRVGVAIVTYNSAGHLPALLASLPAAAAGLELDVVVVDNDSSDDTVDVALAAGVTVVRSPGNLGFAAGVNLARGRLSGRIDALAVINPDTRCSPGSITLLVEALAEPGVGVSVPTLLDDDGRLQHSLHREPSLPRAVCDAVLGTRVGGRWGTTITDDTAYTRAATVDWASGAVWVVSAACDARVGPWEERFFLYSEEVDYARRVRRAGWSIRFVPAARVRHTGGGSGTSACLAALQAVNKVRDYSAGHSRPAAACYRAVLLLHHALRPRAAGAGSVLRALARPRTWTSLPAGELR